MNNYSSASARYRSDLHLAAGCIAAGRYLLYSAGIRIKRNKEFQMKLTLEQHSNVETETARITASTISIY